MAISDQIEKAIKNEGGVQVPQDKTNRFNVIFQKMMSVRWYITFITMITLLAILMGVVLSIMVKASMEQEWKEILLLILGAFIGSYNRVIDFWFNNSQRDQIMLQKIDEEDDPVGTPKSDKLLVLNYQNQFQQNQRKRKQNNETYRIKRNNQRRITKSFRRSKAL
jgi:hypothetical protein